jgi:hypothetical protein
MDPSHELLTQLLAAAIQLSGLPAIHVSELPPIVMLSRRVLNETVCSSAPVRCSGLIAAFDTQRYRIVVDEKLEFGDPDDDSFLVHEFVHVLQFRQSGSVGFTSCNAIVKSEREAYAAQDLYLREHGRPGQYGVNMRFIRCPSE